MAKTSAKKIFAAREEKNGQYYETHEKLTTSDPARSAAATKGGCLLSSSCVVRLFLRKDHARRIDGAGYRRLHFRLMEVLALDIATAAMLQNSGPLAFDRLQAAAAWPGFT